MHTKGICRVCGKNIRPGAPVVEEEVAEEVAE